MEEECSHGNEGHWQRVHLVSKKKWFLQLQLDNRVIAGANVLKSLEKMLHLFLGPFGRLKIKNCRTVVSLVASNACQSNAKDRERESSRGNSFQYSVKLLSGEHQDVCRNAFIAVYGIGKKRFERIQKEAGTGMTSPKYKRGKHHNHRVIEQTIKQQINDHIRSFPRRQSHYSRKDNPNRVYLHENLNMRRMWLMYLNMYEPEELGKLRRREKTKPTVKYWMYCDISTKDHNLSFGQLRADTCNLCDRLNNEIKVAEQNGNVTKKDELKRQLEFHHRKAEKGYTTLQAIMKKAVAGELDLLTFDFQQNLPVPTLKNSDMFYARLLWIYNFGIHNGADDSGCMSIWAESAAKRGASEVCSCLEHYLDTHTPKTDNARTSNQFEVFQMESRAIKDYLKFSRANITHTSLKDFQNGNKTVQIRSIMWFSYGQSEVMDLEEGTVSLVDHPDEIWGRSTFNELETWMKFQPLKRGADLKKDVEARYTEKGVKIKHAKDKDLMDKVVNTGVLPVEYLEFYIQLSHDGPAAQATVHRGDESDDSDGDDYVY